MPATHYVKGLGSQRIFIAVPTAGGIETAFLVSLIETMQLLAASGVGADYCIEAGNCHVDDARNSLVRAFLKTDCTDLIFIDADVGWDSLDLVKLIKYDRDIVGGVYPKKSDEEDYPVQFIGGELWAEKDGLLEVAGLPTGFLRIKRHVLEKLCEKEKARAFVGNGCSPDEPLYYPIFERIIAGGKRMSGDYAFCHKWKQLGGKLYAAPEMSFTHEGAKQWHGKLGDYLRAKNNIANPDVVRLLKRLKEGDDSPKIFTGLYSAWGNDWAASPEMLATVHKLARGKVLETGSGLTTLVAATVAEVHALENDLLWSRRVKSTLDAAGLSANVHVVPIKDYDGFAWYEVPELPASFDTVICDGPVRKYGRTGLFTLLADRIAGAQFIIDDAETNECTSQLSEAHILGEHRKFAVGRK